MTIHEFDRYINGQLMAEGVTIEKAETLEAATASAVRIASKGPNGEAPVLVLRREREPVEPVAWLPTATVKWLSEYDGPACATTTAAYNRPIKSDGGVPVYATPPDALALVAAAYRDAANGTEWTAWGERHNLTDASRRAILARTPADAQAALTAIERAAYERGKAEANEIWSRNSRETFDAMCAMRDAINEHVPMPSLESDMLQGPEASVFCATVAEAVILALLTQEGR